MNVEGRRVWRRTLSVLALGLIVAAGPVPAATLTWDGGVAGTWQDGAAGWLDGASPTNWNGATPDSAVFSGAAPTAVDIAAAGVTAGAVDITGGAYTLGGAGALTLSAGAFGVASDLTATVDAALAGTAGLRKTGGGALLFNNTNKTYTGTTVVEAGTLQIAGAAAGALGASATGAITLDGGALHSRFPSNTTVGYAFTIGDSGGELRNLGTESQRWLINSHDRIRGTGTLTIAFGTNNTRLQMHTTSHTNFTGKWVVDSGGNANRFLDLGQASVNLGNAGGDNALTLRNTGTVLLRGDTLGSLSQGITVGQGGAKINVASGTAATIAGKISGPATNDLEFYLESGTSVLTLSNVNNSWLGNTVLNSGATGAVVRLGNAGVVPDSGGTVAVSGLTILDLNGFSETIGGLSGSGTVTNSAGDATLSVGANDQSTTFSGRLVDGTGSLALTKVGAGTLTLGGGNKTYGGATTISAGAIAIAAVAAGNLGASASGTVHLAGGALYGDFSGNTTVRYLLDVGAEGGELRCLGNGRWYPAADTIAGAGVLTLSFGTNNTRFVMNANCGQAGFTGKWIVDSGTNANRFLDLYQASVNLGAATGDDALTLRNTGTVLLRGDTLGSATQGVTVGGGGAKIAVAGDFTATIEGRISGAVSNVLEFYLENSASVVRLANTNNSWLGTTSINADDPGGTLRLAAGGVFPDAGGNVVLSSLAVLDLSGFSETIGGLAGSGTVRSLAGNATLRVGSNNNSPTFSGVIADGGGRVSFEKIGTGYQTLAGTNTYTGTTTVRGGTLQWNHACLPTNDLYVSSGVTLVLSFAETNTIRRLYLDGNIQPAGLYNSAYAPAGVTIGGSGALLVLEPQWPRGMSIVVW